MFDIGFLEILIISVVALIVVGPERLPHVTRTLGHLLGRARRYISTIKNDIQHEMRIEELRKMHASVQESAHAIENSMRQEINQLKSAGDIEAGDIESASTISNPSSTPAENKAKTEAESKAPASVTQSKPSMQHQTAGSDKTENNAPEKTRE